MSSLDQNLFDAYLQLIVLGAYVDGDLADEERRILVDCIQDYVLDPTEREHLMAFARELPRSRSEITSDWRLRRIRQIKELIPATEHRRSAFDLVVHVTRAHRGIGLRETRLLLELMHELGIEESYARNALRPSRPPHIVSPIAAHLPAENTAQMAPALTGSAPNATSGNAEGFTPAGTMLSV